MIRDAIKAAIYSRKSKFTGKGDSIENQIQLCKEYGKTHFQLTEDAFILYEDEGFSGSNIDRPQFQLLLKDMEAKKFNMLICYRLDRISRNVADFSSTLELLEKHTVSFVSIRENFDTSTPMGKAMIYIASVFAQLERETIAERIRDNMLQLAKTGRWLGGNTPSGYQSEQVITTTIDGKSHKLFKLSPIPDELERIKLLFDKYLEMKSITKLESYCLQNQLETRQGKDYTRYSLRFILGNPVCYSSITETDSFWDKIRIVEGFCRVFELDSIGDKIRYYRLLKKISQQELADNCNISRHSIMRYENNFLLPDLEFCKKISIALNTDPHLLYDDYLLFISNDYGDNIKKARLTANLTQRQLANKLKIKQSTISEWVTKLLQQI